MKIYKSSSSEVFDLYAQVMSKYLIKKATWTSAILEGLASGAKSLADLLSSVGKTSDELIQELASQGKTAEEIATLTGLESTEIKKVLSQAPNAGQVAQTLVDVSPEAARALEEVSVSIKADGKNIINTIQGSKDLSGKTLEEIAEIYESLKRSRSAMKGNLTVLRNELAKAEELGQISAQELAKKDELIQAGEQLLKNTNDEAEALKLKIQELGGNLDQAGNVIKGLEEELGASKDVITSLTNELDLTAAALKDLSDRGAQLTESNKELVKKWIEQSKAAAYYKSLYEAGKAAGEEKTVAGKIIEQAAKDASEEASEASQELVKAVPQAAPVVNKINQKANAAGAVKASEAIKAAEKPAPPTPIGLQSLKPKPPGTPGAPAPKAPAPATSTPTPTPAAAPAPGRTTPLPPTTPKPPAPRPPIDEPSELSELSELSETSKVAPKGKVEPNAGGVQVSNSGKPKSLLARIMGNSLTETEKAGLKGVSGSGGGYLKFLFGMKFLKLAALFGGAYLVWKYFIQSDPEAAKQDVGEIKKAQYSLYTQLKTLKFKEGSVGQQKTADLMSKILTSFRSLNNLLEEPTEENQNLITTALADLDALDLSLEDYERSKDILIADAENPAQVESVLSSLSVLKERNQKLKQDIISGLQKQEAANPEGRVSEVIGRPAAERGAIPGGQGPGIPSQEPGALPQTIKVQDQEINIEDLPRGMRSAAPRIANKILNTPEGLAFIDPDNVWGGWLDKTVVNDENGNPIENKKADYLRAIKYLYLNQIFSPGDLRKFVRKNLPRVGRKRFSGWNQAIKHYSGLQRLASSRAILEKNTQKQEKNKKFTHFLNKTTNNSTTSDNYDESDNYNKTNMNKKADQFSKSYYQDAISGLDDQYAKSYYTGLKGSYDEKPEKTEADFKKTYQVHNETGADLIEQAHPLTITLADAMAEGGVFENAIEQQRKQIGVAKSAPSGNFRNKNAWVIENLVKLANSADQKGLKEASDIIDEVILELTS